MLVWRKSGPTFTVVGPQSGCFLARTQPAPSLERLSVALLLETKEMRWPRRAVVQKGAVLIGNDNKPATFVAAAALALGLLFCAGASPSAAGPATSDVTAPQAISVSLVLDGTETTYPTRAHTVREFLEERNLAITEDDYLSVPADEALADGMRIEYRAAVPVELIIGKEHRTIRTSALTVEALLVAQEVALEPNDEVTPAVDAAPIANGIVRVVRIKTWTARMIRPIAPPVKQRYDATLARGTTETTDPGTPGRREVLMRLVSRNAGKAQRTVLSSRILRKPRPTIVAIGTGNFPSIVEFATNHLNDPVRLAGSPVRMEATAYVANCAGCTGITRLGLKAGHGIVAVDPNFIPLGTKLYVPGYGPALAGDVGGAIKGRRIDLGFNSLTDAINFGRREITVYVLR